MTNHAATHTAAGNAPDGKIAAELKLVNGTVIAGVFSYGPAVFTAENGKHYLVHDEDENGVLLLAAKHYK